MYKSFCALRWIADGELRILYHKYKPKTIQQPFLIKTSLKLIRTLLRSNILIPLNLKLHRIRMSLPNQILQILQIKNSINDSRILLLSFLNNSPFLIDNIINTIRTVINQHTSSFRFLIFPISQHNQIIWGSENNLMYFIFLILNWHYTVLPIIDVVTIFEIIEIRSNRRCSIIIYHYTTPMFLKCFYTTHIHCIFKMTIVVIALTAVILLYLFLGCWWCVPGFLYWTRLSHIF